MVAAADRVYADRIDIHLAPPVDQRERNGHTASFPSGARIGFPPWPGLSTNRVLQAHSPHDPETHRIRPKSTRQCILRPRFSCLVPQAGWSAHLDPITARQTGSFVGRGHCPAGDASTACNRNHAVWMWWGGSVGRAPPATFVYWSKRRAVPDLPAAPAWPCHPPQSRLSPEKKPLHEHVLQGLHTTTTAPLRTRT